MKLNNNTIKSYKLFSSLLALSLLSASPISHAAPGDSNVTCPVGLVSGMDLTTEFGAAVAADTRCIHRRHNVKNMFAIDAYTTDDEDPLGVHSGPYALHQLQNVYNDYTITAGMTPGKDFSLIAVVHGGGGRLLLSDPSENNYIDLVKHLMDEGVKFYFCENTVRGFIRAGLLQQGNVAAGVIPGVHFVTAGLAAMADFEAEGYQYVQP